MLGCSDPEINVYFCPRENCSDVLLGHINTTDKVYCAFYDYRLGFYPQNSAFVFDNYYANTTMLDSLNVNYTTDNSSKLMHNKFCITGDTVLTGSYNPTERGSYYNNNNLVIIKDSNIADLYRKEFFEMFQGTFSGGSMNNPQYSRVKVYFCPEDDCEDRLLAELKKAKSTIRFMTFSFTSKVIADELISKSRSGVSVIGVYEKRLASSYSTFNRLKDERVAVYVDVNKYSMHHKVFIVDNKTVITGSYNPTQNGNRYNDENMLVINNPDIAVRFLEEFEFILPDSIKSDSIKST